MEKAELNGVELEYEIKGSGEPVLLVPTGPLADSFKPFLCEESMSDRYRLIRYHQRGQAGSTKRSGMVSFARHAADAAGLLEHLGIERAHLVGHSTGATIALQMALDYPERVHTLALLEPPLAMVASAPAFFDRVGPFFEAYNSGDRESALSGFLSAVSSLSWDMCRAVLEERTPGSVALAMRDADNVFESFLPALSTWQFGPEQAARITQPVLSVVGTETEPLFAESHELLHSWFPQLEGCVVAGVGHLLHLQRPTPVAEGISEFLGRHAFIQDRPRVHAAVT